MWYIKIMEKVTVTVVSSNFDNCPRFHASVDGNLAFQTVAGDSHWEALGRFFSVNLDSLADIVVDRIDVRRHDHVILPRREMQVSANLEAWSRRVKLEAFEKWWRKKGVVRGEEIYDGFVKELAWEAFDYAGHETNEHILTTSLTDEEREELREHVFDNLMSDMFGDGLEDDYVRYGFPPSFKGVNKMTDEELIDELGHYDPEVDVTFEQRVAAWRKERED